MPSPVHQPSRVLVVDDDLMVRAAVASYLAAAPDLQVVGSVGSGEEALAFLADHPVDLVLLDVRMAGMDGISTARALTQRQPELGIVMLTSFADQDLVTEAIRAGASGYVLKSARAGQIVAALRSARQGMQVVSPGMLAALVQPAAPAQALDLSALTPREREVLELLCRGRSNAQIAHDLTLAESSVKMHVHSIMDKLGTRSRLETVVLVHQGRLPG